MARVKFIADFDYRPVAGVIIGYRAGTEMVVKRDCAIRAVAAGAAVETGRPARETAEDGT